MAPAEEGDWAGDLVGEVRVRPDVGKSCPEGVCRGLNGVSPRDMWKSQPSVESVNLR